MNVEKISFIYVLLSTVMFGIPLVLMICSYRFRMKINKKFSDLGEYGYLVKQPIYLEIFSVLFTGIFWFAMHKEWGIPDTFGKLQTYLFFGTGLLFLQIGAIFLYKVRIVVIGQNVTVYYFVGKTVSFNFEDVYMAVKPENEKSHRTGTVCLKIKYKPDVEMDLDSKNADRFFYEVTAHLTDEQISPNLCEYRKKLEKQPNRKF